MIQKALSFQEIKIIIKNSLIKKKIISWIVVKKSLPKAHEWKLCKEKKFFYVSWKTSTELSRVKEGGKEGGRGGL